MTELLNWEPNGETEDGVPRWRTVISRHSNFRWFRRDYYFAIENGGKVCVWGTASPRPRWIDGDRRHAALWIMERHELIGPLTAQIMRLELDNGQTEGSKV